MTKKVYNQPEVQVAQFASMALMQAQAASTQSMGVHSDIPGDQW